MRRGWRDCCGQGWKKGSYESVGLSWREVVIAGLCILTEILEIVLEYSGEGGRIRQKSGTAIVYEGARSQRWQSHQYNDGIFR